VSTNLLVLCIAATIWD